MIKVQMSKEVFTDMITPGAIPPSVCTRGIPEGVQLIDAQWLPDYEIVEVTFDDGKEEVEHRTVVWKAIDVDG